MFCKIILNMSLQAGIKIQACYGKNGIFFEWNFYPCVKTQSLSYKSWNVFLICSLMMIDRFDRTQWTEVKLSTRRINLCEFHRHKFVNLPWESIKTPRSLSVGKGYSHSRSERWMKDYSRTLKSWSQIYSGNSAYTLPVHYYILGADSIAST